MKVVIIGGVAGGASTAARLRRVDEEAEIVMPPFAVRQTHYSAARLIHTNLGFQRVPLFLTRIAASLLFWGRSMGVSVRGGPANQDIRLSENSASMGAGNRLP